MSPTRAALHEAGHAAASYVLGFPPVGALSIIRNGNTGGICIVGQAPDLESDIMVILAGGVAEDLLDVYGAASPEPHDELEHIAAALEAMPKGEAATLATALLDGTIPESARPFEWDDERVWRLAVDAWPGRALERVPALTARVREMLAANADAVRTLAYELDDALALSSARWHEILADAGLTYGQAALTSA